MTGVRDVLFIPAESGTIQVGRSASRGGIGDVRRGHTRDGGFTFVEVLVAVVLLGTVCVGVLTALRMSVIGTRLERDHAKAYQWLQSADGVLQAADRIGCAFDPVTDAPYTSGEEKVRLGYQQEIRLGVVNPPGWDDRQITVVGPVKVWDGARYWDPNDPAAPKKCFDGDGFLLQLVTMQVTSPDGRIIETIQVVKRD